MGNCLRKSKISAQNNDKCDASVVENVEKVKVVRMLSKLEAAEMEERMMMKKKKVRLMVKNGGSCKSGGVRISVVMSQQELKRMLSCNDEAQQQTSMEQFLHAVMSRGRRISEVGAHSDHHHRISSWKPSLDTIPEDCFSNSNSTLRKQ